MIEFPVGNWRKKKKTDRVFMFFFTVSASDLESIRALFNEKEKELTMAVAKVDELTRQLEDVQKGRGQSQTTSPASMELDKLRAELLVSSNDVVKFVFEDKYVRGNVHDKYVYFRFVVYFILSL